MGEITSSSETSLVETRQDQADESTRPSVPAKVELPDIARIPFDEDRPRTGAFDDIADEAAHRASELHRLGKAEDDPVLKPVDPPPCEPTRPEDVRCALPGCEQVFAGQQYFGKTQRFCCDEHRQRMRTLLIHARWVYESTKCFNALHVLRYLEILCSGMPPLAQPP